MKRLSVFLTCATVFVSANALAASVSSTVGNNLTAYNNGMGSINNNNWNNLTNVRMNSVASAPTADFGNCNALIIRCATPKCANGGCASMEVARPIVSGCVQSNKSCAQYGDELVDYISAQLVSSSTAKANQQAAAAANAAAQQSAQQNAQQMQIMQQQMQQQMQQLAAQNESTIAQLTAALEEQKQATADAIAAASTPVLQPVATTTTTPDVTAVNSVMDGLTAAQQLAAQSGVSADVLAREQISGEILSKVENAETSLKELKRVLNTVYTYAGCNTSGDNCTGPKRVKVFKQRAMEFFEPYDNVLDEIYDALILAQSVGIDITDIYMMLNDTCNVWGKYLCSDNQIMHYNQNNCVNGRSVPYRGEGATVRGGAQCEIGQVVPMSDGGCQLVKMLTSNEEVQRNWLYPDQGIDGVEVRVGCASEALDNSALFRNRKKKASIDIETLQRIIEQDAPESLGSSVFKNKSDIKSFDFCRVGDESYADLQKNVTLKTLPSKICVTETRMKDLSENGGDLSVIADDDSSSADKCKGKRNYDLYECLCKNEPSGWGVWDSTDKECNCIAKGWTFDFDKGECVDNSGKGRAELERSQGQDKNACNNYGGNYDTDKNTCDCSGIKDEDNRLKCWDKFGR